MPIFRFLRSIWLAVCVLAFIMVDCVSAHAAETGHHTTTENLVRKGPAPQEYTKEKPPVGVRQVYYPAAPGELMAWFAMPVKPIRQPVPLVVFIHGGFSFGADDFASTKPFRAAGFAVMTPTFRGENGNPGYFEMMGGEVDDVVSAITWARQQPGIDANHVYLFGHSIGGGLSGLVAERPEARLRLAGGAAGTYSNSAFDHWKTIVPFDLNNQEEKRRRLYIMQLSDMQVPFYIYLGTEDSYSPAVADLIGKLAKSSKMPIKVLPEPGDHMGMLQPAASAFTEVIKADLALTQK